MNILSRLRSPVMVTTNRSVREQNIQISGPAGGFLQTISSIARGVERERPRAAQPLPNIAATLPAPERPVADMQLTASEIAIVKAAQRKVAADARARRQAAINAGWKRAHARAAGRASPASNHGWAKAHAKARQSHGGK